MRLLARAWPDAQEELDKARVMAAICTSGIYNTVDTRYVLCVCGMASSDTYRYCCMGRLRNKYEYGAILSSQGADAMLQYFALQVEHGGGWIKTSRRRDRS